MSLRTLTAIGLLLTAQIGLAAEFSVQLSDSSGKPVRDAVIYVESAAAKSVGAVAEVDQINKEFVPYVSVISAGSKIRFPNKDNIRHHVYSFSPAKKFELKLYSGVPSEPVLFDKAGVVTLGCNIHDWMLAYVLVVDTPWFARSNSQGQASLQLPPGPHKLQIWHPDLAEPIPAQAITVTDRSTPLAVTATLRPRPRSDAHY